MEITMEKSGDAVVVSLAGRLDSATSPEAERRLVDALDSGSRVVYDLEHVEYVSSAGLRVFLVMAKKLRARGGAMAVCSLVGNVYEVFEISGFTSLLRVFSDRAQALAEL